MNISRSSETEITEDQAAAMLRWEAYVGWGLNEKPEAVLHQAEIDRAEYSDRYVMRGNDGVVKWSAVRALHFVTKVCGLTYIEAKAAIDFFAKTMLVLDSVPAANPEDVAQEIIKGSSDIIEAVDSTAHTLSLVDRQKTPLVWAYWEKVLFLIQSHQDQPLDTGLENW